VRTGAAGAVAVANRESRGRRDLGIIGMMGNSVGAPAWSSARQSWE
jgi:ornithine cyclodeaminase/alanine dehydrogenase-like protein (mu-crystallin family)